MFNADDYHSLSDLAIQDFTNWTKDFKSFLKVGKSGRIIDVGCGPGNLTSLMPGIIDSPEATIVGADISNLMIDYARKNYSSDKVSFSAMNVESENLWDTWERESYDVFLSHYCFQWIKNKEMAFKNVNRLLKMGGRGYLSTFQQHTFVPCHEEVADNPLWKDALKDRISKFLFDSKDPEGELKNLFSEAGLKIVDFKTYCLNATYRDMEHFKKFIRAIDPYCSTMEPDVREKYLQAVADASLRVKFGTLGPDGITIPKRVYVTIFEKVKSV